MTTRPAQPACVVRPPAGMGDPCQKPPTVHVTAEVPAGAYWPEGLTGDMCAPHFRAACRRATLEAQGVVLTGTPLDPESTAKPRRSKRTTPPRVRRAG